MVEMKPQRPPWAGPLEKLMALKPVSQVMSKTMHLIDVPLLRLTKGRLSIAWGFPVVLLTTTGAKSGRRRTVPLLYVDRGEDEIAIIGTRFGNTKHPAWYHNLNADPTCQVEIKGRSWMASSRFANEDERAEIWSQAVRNYSGYDVYKNWTEGRVPPVLILTPEN